MVWACVLPTNASKSASVYAHPRRPDRICLPLPPLLVTAGRSEPSRLVVAFLHCLFELLVVQDVPTDVRERHVVARPLPEASPVPRVGVPLVGCRVIMPGR